MYLVIDLLLEHYNKSRTALIVFDLNVQGWGKHNLVSQAIVIHPIANG